MAQFWVKGKVSLMIGRRVRFDAGSKSMVRCWVEFDAGSKGMVRCWIEGDGSMLGPRIGSFVGLETGNWIPKTNLAGKKKN